MSVLHNTLLIEKSAKISNFMNLGGNFDLSILTVVVREAPFKKPFNTS